MPSQRSYRPATIGPRNLRPRRWQFLVAGALSFATLLWPGSAGAQEQLQLSPDQPTVTGTLTGASGGAFHIFSFHTRGAHRPVALRLDVDNARITLGERIGFNVYRATDGAWSARGVPINGDPAQTVAIASVSNLRSLPHLVQLFNYLPGVAVKFTLTAVFDPIVGTPESRGAPVLYAAMPIGAGRVDGLGAGSGDAGSANYLLAYPGGFTPLDVTLAFSGSAKETPRILSASVGAFLWAGRKLVACAGPAKSLWTRATGLVRGTLDFFGNPIGCSVPMSRYRGPIAQDPASAITVSEARVLHWKGGANVQEIGLQVFNYKSSGPPGRVDYVVSAQGLRPRPDERG